MPLAGITPSILTTRVLYAFTKDIHCPTSDSHHPILVRDTHWAWDRDSHFTEEQTGSEKRSTVDPRATQA